MKADEKRSCYTCHKLQTCPHYSVGSVIISNADYCADYMPMTAYDLDCLTRRMAAQKKEVSQK